MRATFLQDLDGTNMGAHIFIFAAPGVVLDLELDERQLRDLDVEPELVGLPHRVEPVVVHVLRLALVVRVGVVGVAPDAHLHVRVDHLPVRRTVRARQVLTADHLRRSEQWLDKLKDPGQMNKNMFNKSGQVRKLFTC